MRSVRFSAQKGWQRGKFEWGTIKESLEGGRGPSGEDFNNKAEGGGDIGDTDEEEDYQD